MEYNYGFCEGVWRLFLETWTDWPIGTILCGLVVILVGLLVGLVLWGVFYLVDSSFLPRQDAQGKVVNKAFTPAHTDYVYIYNASTKTSIPSPVFHPDSWNIQVSFLDTQGSVEVKHDYYEHIKVGDKVNIQYVIGRMSHSKYLKAIVS